MISKISWPNTFEKGNPFGDSDGFRPLTLTLHSKSLVNLSDEDERALIILLKLVNLEDIHVMSFDGQIYPKIYIKEEETKDGFYDIEIMDSNQKTVSWHRGVHKSWLQEFSVINSMNLFGEYDEDKFINARQELLQARAHLALRRDIFVTASKNLINNRNHLEDLNIRTPLEALKNVSLSMRTKNEFEWTSHIEQNIRFQTSRESFYETLTRGVFPHSWGYISALSLHSSKGLIQLGWSVLSRAGARAPYRHEMRLLDCFTCQEHTVPKI